MTQGGRSAALPKPAPNLKDALRFLVDATNEIIRLESLWAPAGTSHPPISNAEAYVAQAMAIIEVAIPLVAERTALENLHDSIEAMRQDARRDLRNPPDDGVSKNFDVAFFGGKSLGLLRARQEVDKLLSKASQR